MRCRQFFEGRQEPLFAFYRVNAGVLPPDSWHNDPVQGGGRIVGEVCHFVDTLSFMTGSTPTRIYAAPAGAAIWRPGGDDGLTVTLRFADGSTGVIHYLTNGDPSVPNSPW